MKSASHSLTGQRMENNVHEKKESKANVHISLILSPTTFSNASSNYNSIQLFTSNSLHIFCEYTGWGTRAHSPTTCVLADVCTESICIQMYVCRTFFLHDQESKRLREFLITGRDFYMLTFVHRKDPYKQPLKATYGACG